MGRARYHGHGSATILEGLASLSEFPLCGQADPPFRPPVPTALKCFSVEPPTVRESDTETGDSRPAGHGMRTTSEWRHEVPFLTIRCQGLIAIGRRSHWSVAKGVQLLLKERLNFFDIRPCHRPNCC